MKYLFLLLLVSCSDGKIEKIENMTIDQLYKCSQDDQLPIDTRVICGEIYVKKVEEELR